jgi:uncharacterized protein YciI
MQFIVIGRDGTDSEALARRLAVREAHIKLGDRYRSENKHLLGVALLDDAGKMCGSVLLVDFSSRDELDAWLAEEPYVVGGVWQTIDVHPCKVGPSFENLFNDPPHALRS